MTNTQVTQADWYDSKGDRYFEGLRTDILDQLPAGSGLRILEIGCGDGTTGEAALSAGIASEYFGVELFESAAADAAGRLTKVICGDIESVDLPWSVPTFDVIIASEVLEHLADPRLVVQRLAKLMVPGGRFFSSSPNVCHYSIIRMLLRGGFDLTDRGAMDRTHLRWFTPRTYSEMFEAAGLSVESVGPMAEPGPKAKILTRLLPKSRRILLWRQVNLRARKPFP